MSEIDEFKGAWRLLGTIAPERLNALRRVATIESIGSSTRIEGSKLTDREVERLLTNLEIRQFSTRDEQEVAGLRRCHGNDLPSVVGHSRHGKPHQAASPRSPAFTAIRTNGIAANIKPFATMWGAFDADGKMIGIVVRDGNAIRYTAADDGVDRVVESSAVNLRSLHPLLIVAVFIVVFLAIHPFQDGNGR